MRLPEVTLGDKGDGHRTFLCWTCIQIGFVYGQMKEFSRVHAVVGKRISCIYVYEIGVITKEMANEMV